MNRTFALLAGLVAVAWCTAGAQAAFIMTLDQVGSNVVATGSGSIDLSGLSLNGSGAVPAQLIPSNGSVVGGDGSLYQDYSGITTAPASFGSGGPVQASTASGDVIGILFGDLIVPSGYAGTMLSDTATYSGATFSSLGVTPGTYTWSWISTGAAVQAQDDSFTLQIGPVTTAAPEPASLALLGTALLGFGAIRRRRQRV